MTEEVIDAKKNRIAEQEAWAMLKKSKTVRIAKGQKYEEFSPKADGRETIMNKAMGPSGNLRAPTYRVKDQFIIGYNPDLYGEWLK